MQPQDVVKICYQAAFGAEHLLADISAAKRYFDAEFDATEPREGELFELLSDEICRVDLGVWKARGLPSDELFGAFVATARVPVGEKERFSEYLVTAEACIAEETAAFSLEEWLVFLGKYKAAGMPAVHHSDAYRNSEKPAYRIVYRRLLSIKNSPT